MGRRPAKLKVELAVAARTDLDRILRYNLRHFGQRHAESYLAFLRSQIDGLARDYPFGLSIEGHPGLRYHIMKRRPGGDGHLALYLVEEDKVLVLRVFHTKQDWPSSL